MHFNLERQYDLHPKELDEKFYFQSLLYAAHQKGLIPHELLVKLQSDCFLLLSSRVNRYLAGDSSSIRTEKAQSILDSIFFTLGIALKTFSSPEDAVRALQTQNISDLYQKGRRRIDTQLAVTKTIHARLMRNLLDTQNITYRSTLADGILGFFKLYRPDYEAQEIHITADYPLLQPINHLTGIEFIHAYVKAAYYENLFYTYFSADSIHCLLCGYTEEYPQQIINLFEPVFTVAIGCVLAGRDIEPLYLSENDVVHISHVLSKNNITEAVSSAAKRIAAHFQISQGLKRYLQSSLPVISQSISAGRQNNTLTRVFPTSVFLQPTPTLRFSAGQKMDNQKYRGIIAEIVQCRFSGDKLALLRRSVHSFTDLEDVLLDGGFSETELRSIFQTLALPELAALLKRFPNPDTAPFLPGTGALNLCACLQQFLSTLSVQRQALVRKTSETMEVD